MCVCVSVCVVRRRFGWDLGGLGDPRPSPCVEAQGGAHVCVCLCVSVSVCVCLCVCVFVCDPLMTLSSPLFA